MERLQGGRYYEACQLADASPEAADVATAERLWDEAERWMSGLSEP